MPTEEFNPKTFFYFHGNIASILIIECIGIWYSIEYNFIRYVNVNISDVDGNGVWDQDEVKALFLQELDKLYDKGTPQADLLKRAEEMERMREHVFNEADLNKDGLIRYVFATFLFFE